MDTNTINHVSLCSGYGGIDLGLKRAIGERLRTVAFVEVECFAVCNLAAKAEAKLLDNAPIWSDLRTFPWGKFHGLVDILSGGYPCQPFSAAGKRLGAEDPRHLWPHISAGIAAMRPAICFFENVEGHLTLGLRDVMQDLGRMGYRTTFCVASASECGAVHQRKRIFILAERSSQRGASGLSRSLAGYEGFAGIADDCGSEGCGDTGNASMLRWQDRQHDDAGAQLGGGYATPWPSRPGERQHEWEPPRVVADAGRNGRRQDESRWQPQGRVVAERNGEATVGDARGSEWRPRIATRDICNGTTEWPQETSGLAQSGQRQTQPSLGRDADGLTHRLDDALLHVSTDNRTDELRLLGNGVVPATAERAFRVLVGELRQLDNA